MPIPEIIGYIGFGLMISMQILTQFGVKVSCSYEILSLAIVISSCMIISLLHTMNVPNFLMQCGLLCISVGAILRLYIKDHWR